MAGIWTCRGARLFVLARHRLRSVASSHPCPRHMSADQGKVVLLCPSFLQAVLALELPLTNIGSTSHCFLHIGNIHINTSMQPRIFRISGKPFLVLAATITPDVSSHGPTLFDAGILPTLSGPCLIDCNNQPACKHLDKHAACTNKEASESQSYFTSSTPQPAQWQSQVHRLTLLTELLTAAPKVGRPP